ncbi:hypothetical protein E5672_07215 [Alteromonas portus]|uniref:Uncharacterized protein n=1 Tax=Alteromonas portus TaxID=2565549 RepID=A0A4U0ZL29_9ALTE|nr:hypothetical protein [Alteromonas portus]TKB03868.1 hypothetical protein E5672_07215 [Alteromonas portus]
MKFLDNFTQEYKESIQKLGSDARNNTIKSSSEAYKKQCNGLLNNYTHKVVEEVLKLQRDNENVTAEEIKSALAEKCNSKVFRTNTLESSYKDILNKFSQAKNALDKLVDVKKQYATMDWWEKCRALLLRVSTAIFIASIILFTSYLAKELEIPLPLRMGIQ